MPDPRALAVALLLATPAGADQVTVFAASSLKTALDAVAADWGAGAGHEVVVSYAGSPQLAQQIVEGAPADLFLSASEQWMDELEGRGLIEEGSRRDLLGNALVLVAHGEAPEVEIGPDLDLAGLLGGGRLAMALVDAVPAGQYGREALTTLGLWDAVEPQVAQAENVRAALALVASGEAPLGIVYASDAIADDSEGGDAVSVVGTFPATSHAPIRYPAALVAGRGSEAARAFLDHLETPEAEAVFVANGFAPLD